MNLSGQSVARLLQRYELAAQDLIVVLDEIEVPLGMLRVRPRGSAGGHNGLKSIIGSLGSNDFIRVRIGIRPDDPVGDYATYVLKPFRRAEAKVVTEAVDLASEAVRVVIREGVQKAMNRFNRRVSAPES
jgi:PTH1 family peptidyl-tRNA hydrolase